MDPATEALRDVLVYRDSLHARLAISDRELAVALDKWARTRPGAVRGKVTETGARFLLGQAGLL